MEADAFDARVRKLRQAHIDYVFDPRSVAGSPVNVEMFFVEATRPEVEHVVRARLASPDDPPGMQPDIGLPTSYDVLIAGDRKRKVALSTEAGGWVAGIESKEVADFALLREMSAAIGTDVLAVQLSEVTGACGYVAWSGGEVTESYFSEEAEDPAGTMKSFLSRHDVPVQLLSFREAVQGRWLVVQKANEAI